MANEELKAAARKELLRRAAKAELARRQQGQAGVNPDIGKMMPNSPVVDPATVPRSREQLQAEWQSTPGWAKPVAALDDLATLAGNGATFGFGPKIAAGLRSKVIGTNYDQDLAQMRAKIDEARMRAGGAGMTAEIGGSVLPAAKLAQAGVTATRLPGMLGKAGLIADGAGYGAVNALGNDQDVLTGAGIGAAGGAAGKVLGSTASSLLGKFTVPKPQVMTAAQIKDASRAAYEEADKAGVIFKPEAVQRLKDDLYKKYAEFGFHPTNQPGANVAFNEIERLAQGGNVGLKGLDTARKVASGGFNPTNKSNNALLGQTIEIIDNFATNAGPYDVLAGDPAAASEALKKARELWGRGTKLDRVKELMGRAELNAGSTGSGGNTENATRQQLKRLLTNPKMTRGMTADEIKATQDAVVGTKSQNLMRLAGKLSPGGNGLMAALQLGAAGATGGATLPIAALGAGAKYASEKMTKNSAQYLQDLIASGGKASALRRDITPTQKKQIEAMIRALMIGSVTQLQPSP